MYFSPTVASMPASGIRKIGEAAATRPGTIELHLGEPDSDTPPLVIQAAARAAADGQTHYTANAGIPELRRVLADKVGTINGVSASADNIIVTNGAVEGLFMVMTSVLAPGDSVLVPDPCWPNYRMTAQILGARNLPYPVDTTTGDVDVAALEGLVAEDTRAIMINTPSNPLGTLISEQNLHEIYAFARAHDLWIISDEVYDQLVFNGTMVSMGAVEREELQAADVREEELAKRSRVISVYSFSKTYAMTGWRVGYLVVPDELAAILTKIQEAIVSCVNTPAQYAAIEAVTGPQDFVADAMHRYGERAALAERLFADAGIRVTAPDGAFYLWVDTGSDGQEIAEKLVLEHGVAVAPGPAFGAAGRSAIRLCLAVSVEDLTEGIGRIVRSGLLKTDNVG